MISVLTPSIRPEGLKIIQDCLQEQTYQDFEWLVEVGLPKRGHDLNASYNRLLKRARGDLVVFYQDYIKVPTTGLKQFLDAYMASQNTYFTAPVGKTLDWKKATWDWRIHPEAQMDWTRFEIDWAAGPREGLVKIGGFDEVFDKHWSADNVSVGCRLNQFGYKFACLPFNKALALDHDKLMPHPFRYRYNPQFTNQKLEEYKFNPKLAYLD